MLPTCKAINTFVTEITPFNYQTFAYLEPPNRVNRNRTGFVHNYHIIVHMKQFDWLVQNLGHSRDNQL